MRDVQEKSRRIGPLRTALTKYNKFTWKRCKRCVTQELLKDKSFKNCLNKVQQTYMEKMREMRVPSRSYRIPLGKERMPLTPVARLKTRLNCSSWGLHVCDTPSFERTCICSSQESLSK